MPGMKQRIKDGLMLQLLRHSRFFNEKWYREKTGIPPDVDAVSHYYYGGWRNHDPSPEFRQEEYLKANEDVRRADICPLAHYLFYGKRSHVQLYPGWQENHYYRHRASRALLRGFYEGTERRYIRRNRQVRILVVMYIRFPEALKEMLEYLKNLRPYNYDLIVTISEGEKEQEIREGVLAFKGDAEVRTAPERGADVTPFLEMIHGRNLRDYDLLVRIHSLETDPRDGVYSEGRRFYGRDRFLSAFRAVLGAGHVHRNIDRLMRDEGVSLIAAGNLITGDSRRKEWLTEKTLSERGLSLDSGYTWIIGGCFMMAPHYAEILSAIEPLEDDLSIKRGAFSAVSALERYVTGIVPEEKKLGRSVCCCRRAWRKLRHGGDLPERRVENWNDTASADEEKPRVAAFAVTETGENAVAGDYFTAKELAEALRKRGWETRFLSRKEPRGGWYRVGCDVDVLISMLEDYDPQHITDDSPELVTIGWARNQFDRWIGSTGVDQYEILLASSETAQRKLEEKLCRKVRLFPIATNAERFREKDGMDANPTFICDYCFTGNRFGQREIESELDPEEIPYRLKIFGDGWKKVRHFAPYCQGHIPYSKMPEIYHAARIVLDDATPSTRKTGAVNSRVYDALAAGCLVLTNNELGSKETFDGKLPVFYDSRSLKEQLMKYLGNEGLRQEKVRELQAMVLERHTYDCRAEQLESILREERKL